MLQRDLRLTPEVRQTIRVLQFVMYTYKMTKNPHASAQHLGIEIEKPGDSPGRAKARRSHLRLQDQHMLPFQVVVICQS